MKITKTYLTSAGAYFDSILTSLRADYQRSTGKHLETNQQLTGLKYITSFGNKGIQQAEVEIVELIENQRYRAIISSNRGKQIITYDIDSLSPNQIRVNYEEIVEQTDFFTKWNYKLLSILFRKSLQKKMEAQLDFIFNKI